MIVKVLTPSGLLLVGEPAIEDVESISDLADYLDGHSILPMLLYDGLEPEPRITLVRVSDDTIVQEASFIEIIEAAPVRIPLKGGRSRKQATKRNSDVIVAINEDGE